MKIFSKEEIKDLLLSLVVITLVFSFKPFPHVGIDYAKIPYYLLIATVAFLFHELAHKFVAMKFGCMAVYKIWPVGIFYGLILMLVGIPFVAPGAMMIYPYFFGRWGYRVKTLTPNENGLIALSGPATNLFFAIIFSLFDGYVFQLLTYVNAWIAFFNLIPVKPLDGSKILEWRIWIWGLMIAISGVLVALSIGLMPV
jgi:Zn-dependent protease